MSIAISDINPELTVINDVNDVTYQIDSGVEDLNRIVSSNTLETSNFKSIEITGFNKYLYFEDTTALSEVAKRLIKEPNLDLAPYEKKLGDTAISVVAGQVSVELSTDELVNLCSPIYQVYPDDKGVLYPIFEINQYISREWMDKCKTAFFESKRALHVSPAGFTSTQQPEDILRNELVSRPVMWIFILALVVSILAFIAYMFATPAVATSVTGAGGFVNASMSTPMSYQSASDGLTAPVGGVDYARPEDMAKMQLEQREAMLKQMGVDVKAGSQNLGCFTEAQS